MSRSEPIKTADIATALDKKEQPVEAPRLKNADEAMGSGLAYVWARTFWSFGMPFFRMAVFEASNLSPASVPKGPSADAPAHWAAHMKSLMTTKSPVMAYLSFIWPMFRLSYVFGIIACLLMFVTIKVNEGFISQLEAYHAGGQQDDFDWTQSYYYAAVLLSVPTINGCLMSNSIMQGYTAGRRSYAAYCTLLFQKPAQITAGALSTLEEGTVVNMMAADAHLILNITLFLQFAILLLMMLLISAGMIIADLGYIGVPAVVALIAISFFNKQVGDWVQVRMKNKSQKADKRSSLLNETIKGARTIKLYGWEDVAMQKVAPIRAQEVHELKMVSWMQALLTFLMSAFPKLALAGTLFLYVQLVGNLEASRALAIAGLFEMLNAGANIIPMFVVQWGEMKVAIRRMSTLLNKVDDFIPPVSEGAPGEVVVEKADFSWTEEEAGVDSVAQVKNISMKIQSGKMVAIVGEVASGKTTLAHGLLSLLRVTNGTVKIGGRTALVAQKSFVTNDTVRSNIVFEGEFDQKLYDRTLSACALTTDLKQFVNGDLTEIGERGVTISGGQKQRISLARAAYSDADVIVFDDPLSAMDAHVGMKVFDRCFKKMLGDKTRVFFTNQLQYCEHCDYIFVMKDGE
jgi:ATP-binding cassette subfamily C (CFTR/MRP) protein 1